MSQTATRLTERPSRIQLTMASMKHRVKQYKTKLFDFIARAKYWQHETIDFQLPNTTYTVRYIGRASRLCMLKPLLGATDAEHIKRDSAPSILVTEFAKPNSICVPACLTTVVPLNKPVDDIVASYAKSLRRALKKQLVRFTYQAVSDASAIEQVNKTMLQPYAIARNGDAAHHFTQAEIEAMALGSFGGLDLLLENGEPVGCHLGNAYTEKGKRYWHVNRFGYIANVFNDYKYLQEANSANLHLALMKAIAEGYDYCDYGVSLAKPGDGLLEWKRRRKGMLKQYAADGCFYLIPPQEHQAAFYWENPLFALEGNAITLHLGVPTAIAPEEALSKYKEMGYDGLAKVYLHVDQPVDSALQDGIAKLYESLTVQPQIIIQ